MKEGIYRMPNAPEEKKVFPVVALRDLVIYPDVTVNLDIGRKESVEAVRQAESNEQKGQVQKKSDVKDKDKQPEQVEIVIEEHPVVEIISQNNKRK